MSEQVMKRLLSRILDEPRRSLLDWAGFVAVSVGLVLFLNTYIRSPDNTSLISMLLWLFIFIG